jgi:hypothetical protein
MEKKMTSEKSLSADEMFNLADECRHLSKELGNYRLGKSEITKNQAKKIAAFEFDLLSKVKLLGTIASDKVIETDLKQPAEKILGATKKLTEALKNLEQINKMLGVLASFLNLIGAVVSAVATPGLPGVANVSLAFQNLSNALEA